MKQTIKRLGIAVGFLILVLCIVYYFVTVHGAYNYHIYGSPESACDIQNGVAYAFRDDSFYAAFTADGEIKAAKRNTSLWVKAWQTSFQKPSSVMAATTVGNTMYIYGVTYQESVQKVKILDSLTECPSSFTGKRLEELDNALCFCLVIPLDRLSVNCELVFVNERDEIVSELPDISNSEKHRLLVPVLEELNHSPRKVNDQSDSNENTFLYELTVQKFYLLWQPGKKYELQEYREGIEVSFGNTAACITKKRVLTTPMLHDTRVQSYDEAYQLPYTDAVVKLKEYALEQQEEKELQGAFANRGVAHGD